MKLTSDPTFFGERIRQHTKTTTESQNECVNCLVVDHLLFF